MFTVLGGKFKFNKKINDLKRKKIEYFWATLEGKGGFKSEDFPPETVNNLFKFSAQDSDLEYLSWQGKNSSVSSDLKPPLVMTF